PNYVSQQNTSSDYSMFGKTFGVERYNDLPWYGGSINNNTSHYDLITIGNVDFVILYLGYGLEATDETIEWANNVLQTYSHRSAIIATHQYLKNSIAARYANSRANLIFNKIVEPNPNVKMVLCGHDDGAQVLEATTSDGRVVYEILSDYQFVEAEDRDFYNGLEHYIGKVAGCCGDGYLRQMTITGSYMHSITYSPITGRYNPYGDREDFTINADFAVADREIHTSAFSAVVLGEEITSGENSVTVDTDNAWIAAATQNGHTSYTPVVFPTTPERVPYEATASNDYAALTKLIALVDDDAPTGIIYTPESESRLASALDRAKGVMDPRAGDISDIYVELLNAYGGLEVVKPTIDKSTLESIFAYPMELSKWKSSESNMSLAVDDSYIKASVSEGGGIYMKNNSKLDWPSAYYSGNALTVKPNNGKIYISLDVIAESSWCIYLTVDQGGSQRDLRLNQAIQGAFNNPESDGYAGTYQGVFDVTSAFEKAGFDPSATFTITRTILYIVPTAATFDEIEFLTDVSDGTVDKTALQELINTANAYDSSLYTITTYNRLQTAITAAQQMLDDENAVQADVNLTVIQLRDAMSKLKLLSEIVPEPENSLLPADEGQWVPISAGLMDIYRDENGYTVLQNTNSQWPSADYTLPTPYVTTVVDKQFTIDVTVGENTNMYAMIDGTWIRMTDYISAANTNSAGDLGAGTYQVGIPLSSIKELAGKESVTITKLRVYAVGSAANSAVTIRKWMVDDYEAPPFVYQEKTSMMPESAEQITEVEGNYDGSYTLENGVLTLTANNNYRIVSRPTKLYNMDELNGVYLKINSTVPFKMAWYVRDAAQTAGNWPTTSSYTTVFDIANDRVPAGEYDVTLDLAALCTGIGDKSSVYWDQMIILMDGEGTLTLSVCDVVFYDTYAWDESLTYGEAATPDNPYYAHAAKEAPQVEKKVDLLEALGLSKHPTFSAWTAMNKSMNLKVDLNETPYLYYSFAQADDSSFTFGLYNDNSGSKVPWFIFRDTNADGAGLVKNVANWDAYQNREQYVFGSETGCIDMREYVNDPAWRTWIVNSVTFYNYKQKNCTVSYMFFGSEPIKEEPVAEIGDLDGSGTVNMADAFALYRAVSGQTTLTDAQEALADIDKNGIVNMADAFALYRKVSGAA
ncbi:MAG: hypothetical protein IJU16_07955, partial [Clostridia bacterium]|nr:hypothetical protein [Clostridia bacterium]